MTMLDRNGQEIYNPLIVRERITGNEYLPEWTQVLRYWACPYCGVETKPEPDHGITPDQIVTCAVCPPLTFREWWIAWQRQQDSGFKECWVEQSTRENDQRIRNRGVEVD